jgi:Zn finger protein HypA/HybF involved in hydrogenase expression
MKIILYLLAAALGFVGFMFVAGSRGNVSTLVVGIVLLVAAGALIYMSRVQPQVTQTTTVQKIDLTGDVRLEEMRCRSCQGVIGKDNIEVKAGAIYVECPFCGATYQLEEEPKW